MHAGLEQDPGPSLIGTVAGQEVQVHSREEVISACLIPTLQRPGEYRLTLLVTVDADDLTEGYHQGIVPVNTEKERRDVMRPTILPSLAPALLAFGTTLKIR